MVNTAPDSRRRLEADSRDSGLPNVFHRRLLRKPVKVLGAGATVALVGVTAASPELVTSVMTGVARASLSVSAIVYPFARINSDGAPAQVNLTAANIAAGFVDFRDVPISLSHNTPKGFTLWVTFDPRVVKQIDVEVGGQTTRVATPNSPVAVFLPPALNKSISAHFRIQLAPGVTQGVIPWPLALAVSPSIE